MNLRDFLDYRKDCLSCGLPLTTYLHSQRQQTIRFEDDRLLVMFYLSPLNKAQIDYKVGYSFGLDDNSWYVEFYTKDDKKFENDSPNFLISRFKELDKNLVSYEFGRSCSNCHSYFYRSNIFLLDKRDASILCPEGTLEIQQEYIGIATPLNDGLFKILKVLNRYDKKSCLLGYGQTKHHYAACVHVAHEKLSSIEIPIINIANKQEIAARLNKLLIFS